MSQENIVNLIRFRPLCRLMLWNFAVLLCSTTISQLILLCICWAVKTTQCLVCQQTSHFLIYTYFIYFERFLLNEMSEKVTEEIRVREDAAWSLINWECIQDTKPSGIECVSTLHACARTHTYTQTGEGPCGCHSIDLEFGPSTKGHS